MNTIVLHGCTPEPLGNYLKALGVFRLVAEQADPAARAWWRDGVFCLATVVEDIAAWFKSSYRPSPIAAPWSLNSGWWPPKSQPPSRGDKRNSPYQALRMICASSNPRYEGFRACLQEYLSTFEAGSSLPDREAALPEALRTLLGELERASQKRTARSRLHRTLRNSLQGTTSLQWLDVVGAAARTRIGAKKAARGESGPDDADSELVLFPLVADAGAEGVNSFAGNFYQRLVEHVPFWEPQSDFWQSEQGRLSKRRLRAALFADAVVSAREADAAGGLYFPGLVEAPNAGQKFVSDPKKRTNPWDFILAMEGLLQWAAAATRRCMVGAKDRSSFPFFCESSLGGVASLGPAEVPGNSDSKTRGELWCPLWDQPASFSEVCRLFSEGRVTVADRTAVRASEFAVGVASLGIDRGLSSFARTGLLERSGSGDQRTTLAIPLGEWTPRGFAAASVLDELLDFGTDIAILLQHHENQPRRLVAARERFERAVFDAAGHGSSEERERLLAALVSASALQRELGVARGKVKYELGARLREREIPPIAPLSSRWVDTADDGSTEFRLARAIASIGSWPARGDSDVAVGSLLPNLLPLRRDGARWSWDGTSRSAVWSRGAGLLENLAAVLYRRLVDAVRGKGDGLPLRGSFGAEFRDLVQLWRAEIDEKRVEDLIHALALVDLNHGGSVRLSDEKEADPMTQTTSVRRRAEYDPEAEAARELPRAYAVLKLCFVGGRLPPRPAAARTGEEPFPPRVPEILNLLRAGRTADALTVAARRLRAKGCPSIIADHVFRTGEFALTPAEGQRLAGLLLVPARHLRILATLAIKPVSS